MTEPSLNSKLVAMGVSKPYASQLASGSRDPSMALAIRIYREIGVKLGPIKQATAREIDTLEKVSDRNQTASGEAAA